MAIRTSTTSSKSPKARFLDSYENECATTLKVLRAVPEGQGDFRPHERSNTMKQLAWTFVVEGKLALMALKRDLVLGRGFPKAPDSWDAILEAFNQTHDELLSHLRDEENADLDGTVTFFTGPKQTGEIPVENFLWFMLHDHIHHRGQMSVYVRMAGGQVPSIYGPSADEPWN